MGLSRSTLGRVLTFSCYGAPPNSALDPMSPSNAIPRVVGMVYQNGTIDTSVAVNSSARGAGLPLLGSPVNGTFFDEPSNTLWLSAGRTQSDAALIAFTPPNGLPALVSNGTLWRTLFRDTVSDTLLASHSPGDAMASPVGGIARISSQFGYPRLYTTDPGGVLNDTLHNPDIGSVLYQNSSSIWTADCQWGLNWYALTPSAWVWRGYFRPPSSAGFRWVAGRMRPSGSYLLIGVTCPTTPGGQTAVWGFEPPPAGPNNNGRWYPMVLTPPPNTVYAGIAPPPHDGSPFGSTTQSPLRTLTPTLTLTPSRSPHPSTGAPSASPRANVFQPSSLLVVRSGWEGDATDASIMPGGAQPVFIDEIAVWEPGVRIQSVPLPALSAGASAPCTLSWGSTADWAWDQEGTPSLSSDGTVLALPCYATANTPGVATPLAISGGKTIALLRSDGTVDTSTVLIDAYSQWDTVEAYPAALRGCATANGSSMYTVGGGGGVAAWPPTSASVRYVGPDVPGSISPANFNFSGGAPRLSPSWLVSGPPNAPTLIQDPRSVSLFGGRLYVAAGIGAPELAAVRFGVVALLPGVSAGNLSGLPVPTGNTPVVPVMVPGTDTHDPFMSPDGFYLNHLHSFWWEDNDNLWVADDSHRALWNVIHYESKQLLGSDDYADDDGSGTGVDADAARAPYPIAPGVSYAPVAGGYYSLDVASLVFQIVGRTENVTFNSSSSSVSAVTVLYAATASTIYRLIPALLTAGGNGITPIAVAVIGTSFHGVSSPPLSQYMLPVQPTPAPPTATPSRSASVTPSASRGASPSQNATVSATPLSAALFQSTSVLVLRSGPASGAGSGGSGVSVLGDVLLLDELSPSLALYDASYGGAGLLRSVNISAAVASLTGSRWSCSAKRGTHTESFPLITGNGQLLSIPCFDSALGAMTLPGAAKIVVLVGADGRVNVSIRVADAYYSSATASGSAASDFRCAFSVDGSAASGFYLVGAAGSSIDGAPSSYVDATSRLPIPGVSDMGVRFANYAASGTNSSGSGGGSGGSRLLATSPSVPLSYPNVSADVRLCSSFAGQLYCSVGSEAAFLGLVVYGGALIPLPPGTSSGPPAASPSLFRQLAGWGTLADGASLSIWGFYFASWDVVWATTTSSPAAQIILVTFVPAYARYLQSSTQYLLDPRTSFYTLTGRIEANAGWDGISPGLVLYTCSPISVWVLNTITGASHPIGAVAPGAGYTLRGVVLPPLGGTQATHSSTYTSTRSSSSFVTYTPSTSPGATSATASRSGTPSTGATRSHTSSSSPSLSSSGSASGSSSASITSAASQFPSPSPLAAAWLPGSILVLRGGIGAPEVLQPDIGASLHIDEFDPNGPMNVGGAGNAFLRSKVLPGTAAAQPNRDGERGGVCARLRLVVIADVSLLPAAFLYFILLLLVRLFRPFTRRNS